MRHGKNYASRINAPLQFVLEWKKSTGGIKNTSVLKFEAANRFPFENVFGGGTMVEAGRRRAQSKKPIGPRGPGHRTKPGVAHSKFLRQDVHDRQTRRFKILHHVRGIAVRLVVSSKV